MTTTKSSLTKAQRRGYCVGIVAESVLYNMYFTYYLEFLTKVAKMDPALAGTVSLISVLWDAVTDPIIGYWGDKKAGNKRKFMMRAAFPMGLTFAAAFLETPGFSSAGKFIFYTAMTMLFWLAYTFYCIPYYAVLAEITQDYDERTRIRGASSLVNTGAILTGNAAPAVLPGLLVGMGFSLSRSWFVVALILGAIAILFALITTCALRGVSMQRDEKREKEAPQSAVGIFKTYLSIIRLRPFKWFMVFIFFFLMASSMLQSNALFLIQDRLGLSGDYMTLVLGVLVVTMAVLIPVATKISEKYDRRTACILFFSVMLAGLLIMKLVGVNTLVGLGVIAFIMGIGMASFWTVFYSFAYDLVEIDEFVNGERREGAITGFPQFVQKFGCAIGVWINGLLLSLFGFNEHAAIQSETVKAGIESVSTLIPAVLLAISILGLLLYPVTKKTFTALEGALEKKRRGEDYTTTGFEKLL